MNRLLVLTIFLVVFAGSEALDRSDVTVNTGKGFSSIEGDLIITVNSFRAMDTLSFKNQMWNPDSTLTMQFEFECYVPGIFSVALKFIPKDTSLVGKSITIRNITLGPVHYQDSNYNGLIKVAFPSHKAEEIVLQQDEEKIILDYETSFLNDRLA